MTARASRTCCSSDGPLTPPFLPALARSVVDQRTPRDRDLNVYDECCWRLLCHRPNPPDIPSPGRTARGHDEQREWELNAMGAVNTLVALAYLAAAVAFVLGLHLMNSPDRARRGNQLSFAGMTVGVAAT